MVVGHEFVGEIVEVGDNVNDYTPGMIVSGEGHIVCGRCRNCMAGRRHLCPYTSGVGVNRAGRLRRIYRHPQRQCLAPCRRHRSRRRLDLRSVRQRHPHRLAMGSGRRGRADHRRRPDRRDGRRGLPPCRRAPRRHHRRQRLPARCSRSSSAPPARSMSTKEKLADVQKELGMTEGFDVGLEMSGNPQALRDMLDNMAHGGKISMLGIPAERDRDRLEQGRLQHADHEGHLRPRDFRDLVQDERDDPVRPRSHADHHPPPALSRSSSTASRRCSRAAPARSCSTGSDSRTVIPAKLNSHADMNPFAGRRGDEHVRQIPAASRRPSSTASARPASTRPSGSSRRRRAATSRSRPART